MLNLHDRAPINQCLQFCGLDDIVSTRSSFTWNNKQSGNARVFLKLDRILMKLWWINMIMLKVDFCRKESSIIPLQF